MAVRVAMSGSSSSTSRPAHDEHDDLMLARCTAFLALAVGLAFLAGLALWDPAPSAERRTAVRRAALLRRGVNLSGWFAQGQLDPAHLQSAITADDVERIRRMGFDHVRLPIDPVVL